MTADSRDSQVFPGSAQEPDCTGADMPPLVAMISLDSAHRTRRTYSLQWQSKCTKLLVQQLH